MVQTRTKIDRDPQGRAVANRSAAHRHGGNTAVMFDDNSPEATPEAATAEAASANGAGEGMAASPAAAGGAAPTGGQSAEAVQKEKSATKAMANIRSRRMHLSGVVQLLSNEHSEATHLIGDHDGNYG